jgi:phosphoribosylglycinamide formyltransferase 1
MINIAVFASGSGSNAVNIARYFRNHPQARVTLIVSNKSDAPVLEKARSLDIETHVITKEHLYKSEVLKDHLHDRKIDFIVLAGFMLLVPEYLVKAFPGKMINIHPALLPAYGGKGMYGMHVHEAVIQNREQESGITIHYVNEEYDKGEHIFQAKCRIDEDDTPEMLAKKIQKLEHAYYPAVLEGVLKRIALKSMKE